MKFTIADLRLTMVWAALLLLLSTLNFQLSTAWAYPPAPATQAQVDAGREPYLYVTPATLVNWSTNGSFVGGGTNIYNVAATNIIATNDLTMDVPLVNNTSSNLMVIAGVQISPGGMVEMWVDYGSDGTYESKMPMSAVPDSVYSPNLQIVGWARPGDTIMVHDVYAGDVGGTHSLLEPNTTQRIYTGIGAVGVASGGGGGGDITAASLTSGTNSFVGGTFTGNGAGLTNLVAASPTNSGVISTNLYTSINLTPEVSTRPPLKYFNTWITMGANFGTTNILEMMTNMIKWGYRDLDYGIMLDEGWMGGFNSAGDIYAVSNRFPEGMKWLVDSFHAQQMKLGLICVLGANGVNIGRSNLGMHTNLFQSATNIAGWGVDVVYLICDDCDNVAGGRWHELQKQFIAYLQGTGKNIQIQGGVGSYFDEWMPNQLGAGLLWNWPGYSDGAGDWHGITAFVDNYPGFFSGMVRPGHYPYFGFQGGCTDIAGALSLPLYKTRAAMTALWHSSVAIAQAYESYEIKQVHTNQLYLSIVNDSLASPPSLVASNNSIQVWSETIRNAGGNERAVVFMNRDTNVTSHTCTIGWTNLGLFPGTYKVEDVWNMTNGTVTVTAASTLSYRLTNYQSGFLIITKVEPSSGITNNQTGVTLAGMLNSNPPGSGNVNYGTNAFVGGNGSTVGGLATNAFAFGNSMNVTGARGIGIGGGVGGGTVSGTDAVGLGNQPTASGQWAMAFGAATASGSADYAFGPQALASGNYGFAIGYKARKTAQGAFMINCDVSADVFRTNSTADSFMVWATGGHRLYGSALTITNGLTINSNYVASNFTPPPAGEIKWAVSNGFFWTITTLKTNYTGISAN